MPPQTRATKRVRTESIDATRCTKRPKQRNDSRYDCLIPLILGEVGDQASLRSLTFTSFAWSVMTVRWLYREPYFWSFESIQKFVATLEKEDNKYLRDFVRIVNICTPHSPDQMSEMDLRRQQYVQFLLNLPSLEGIKIGRGSVSHSLFYLSNLPKKNSVVKLHIQGSVRLFHPDSRAYIYGVDAPAIPWVDSAGGSFSRLRRLVLKDLRIVSQEKDFRFDNVLEELEVVRCSFTHYPSFLMSGALNRLRRLRIMVNEKEAEQILHVCRESKCLEELYILSSFDNFELIFVHPLPTVRKLECMLSNKSLGTILRIFPNVEFLAGRNSTELEISAALLPGKLPYLKQLILLDYNHRVVEETKRECARREIDFSTSWDGTEWSRYESIELYDIDDGEGDGWLPNPSLCYSVPGPRVVWDSGHTTRTTYDTTSMYFKYKL